MANEYKSWETIIWRFAIYLAAISKQYLQTIATLVTSAIKAINRLITNVLSFLLRWWRKFITMIVDLYIEFEGLITAVIADLFLLIWAFRSFIAIGVLEYLLIYYAFTWPFLWFLAVGFAIILIGAAIKLKRDFKEIKTDTLSSPLSKIRPLVLKIMRWALRVGIFLICLFLSISFLNPERLQMNKFEFIRTMHQIRHMLNTNVDSSMRPEQNTTNNPVSGSVAAMTNPAGDNATSVNRDSRFITNDNETVLDTQTKLMWASNDNGDDIDWYNAQQYCNNYRGSGYTDWRMPTQDELAMLYDESVNDNDEYHLTRKITIKGCCLWASDIRDSQAADFGFVNGKRSYLEQSFKFNHRALPVRTVNDK